MPGPRPPATSGDDGRDAGLSLLISFLAAALLMVGAVVAVGIVDRSWILVPVMVVDLAATFCVLATIGHLLRDNAGSG
jgi:fatty acid desaturase